MEPALTLTVVWVIYLRLGVERVSLGLSHARPKSRGVHRCERGPYKLS